MAQIFVESFDYYGDGTSDTDANAAAAALAGRWAEMHGFSDATPAYPSFGARTGAGALRVYPQSGGTFNGARVVLPSTYAELFIHMGAYMEALPQNADTNRLLSLRSSANAVIGQLLWMPDGSIKVTNEAGSTLGSSPANTLTAGSWHSVQVRWLKSATVGVVEIKVNDVVVLSLTGQNTGATVIGGLAWHINGSSTDPSSIYIDDIVVNSTAGTYNTGYTGDVRVATQFPRADHSETGWSAQPRAKFGTGVLQCVDADGDGVTCSDSADLELGSGDFTIEGWFKFAALPASAEYASLFSKWRESTNERSYQLLLGGAAFNGSELAFRMSTDGQTGTVATLVSTAFTPVLGRWYHIAVQRGSAATTIYIDGVRLAAPQADANTYHNNASLFCAGGQQDGASLLADSRSVVGFIDEFRFTKGVARYGSGFTAPTIAFGRGVGDDADFASVSLLCGFDSGTTDDSSFGRAVTLRGAANSYQATDVPPGDYKVLDEAAPLDDSYAEAALTPAVGYLTLTANPANGETVTVDDNVYTFNTVLGGAGSILIGATADASINNLAAAINGGAGSGTLYGTSTVASDEATAANIGNSVMSVTADTAGTGGNAIDTTETLANGAWTGATLSGGANIPGVSSYLMDRLPPGTTGVQSVTILKRARKTDSGPGTVQAALLTADGSSANGTADALTTSFVYYEDIIEEDPSTTAGLTPSTFVGSRIRLDRTA